MSFGGRVLRNKVGIIVLMATAWAAIAPLWFWLGYFYLAYDQTFSFFLDIIS
ncbi:MAG: hypothetical protein WC375_03940 [Methanomassiliicoccales archaeon]